MEQPSHQIWGAVISTVLQQRVGHSGILIESGGTVNYVPWHAIGAVAYNTATTSVTVYLNFTVSGPGNNPAYLVFEITDPQEVADFIEMLNAEQTSFIAPTSVTPVVTT